MILINHLSLKSSRFPLPELNLKMKTLSWFIPEKCFALAILIISITLFQFADECHALLNCYAGKAVNNNGKLEGYKQEIECSGVCTVHESGIEKTYGCFDAEEFQCLEKESGQTGCITGSAENFTGWDETCLISEFRRRLHQAVGDKKLCACNTDHCNDYKIKLSKDPKPTPSIIRGCATLVVANTPLLLTPVTFTLFGLVAARSN